MRGILHIVLLGCLLVVGPLACGDDNESEDDDGSGDSDTDTDTDADTDTDTDADTDTDGDGDGDSDSDSDGDVDTDGDADSDTDSDTDTSEQWTVDLVDSQVGSGRHSMVLDQNGAVHISYQDGENHVLKYATNATEQWVLSVVDEQGDVGESSSLAVDGDGAVHVCYYDTTNGDLKYAVKTDQDWEIQTVVDSGDVGIAPSLALDEDGNAHVSYFGHPSSTIQYATNGSGAWVATEVQADIEFYASSLAVVGGEIAYVAYVRGTKLMLAIGEGESWDRVTVNENIDGPPYMSLDEGTYAHIVYLTTEQSLNYVTNAPDDLWNDAVVDENGPIDEALSSTIDPNGKVHISHVFEDRAKFYLKYTTNATDNGEWESTVVFEEHVSTSNPTPIAVDRLGNIHIVFVASSSKLQYATNSGR